MVLRGYVPASRIEVVEGPPLPEEATVEVDLRFVAPVEDPALAFYGLWTDRDDLGEAPEFVDLLP
jgi:hypothetical protein